MAHYYELSIVLIVLIAVQEARQRPWRGRPAVPQRPSDLLNLIGLTDDLRSKMVDFRGFDSSTILILRGGILMSKGDFPKSLSQAILVGIILVGRLGVQAN